MIESNDRFVKFGYREEITKPIMGWEYVYDEKPRQGSRPSEISYTSTHSLKKRRHSYHATARIRRCLCRRNDADNVHHSGYQRKEMEENSAEREN